MTAGDWPTAAADIAARWEHGHDQLTTGCALCTAEYNEVRAWSDRQPIADREQQ